MSSRFHDYIAGRQAAMSTMADAAIAVGLPVFPCGPTKQPITAHGFKDASQEPDAIRRMFTTSAVMIGVPTGEVTGCVVIDVDRKENRQGGDWLNANSHRLPQTRTIKTGSGGLHLYFRWPGQRVKNSNDKIAAGIDVRGDGGYVIVPPSPGYRVADDLPMADLPDWLLPILCPPEPAPQAVAVRLARTYRQGGGTPYGLAALSDECDAIMNAPFGSQESTLNSAGLKIGALVAGGELEEGEALSALLSAARSLPSQPGKPRWSPMQLDQKARRAFSDGRRQPRRAPDTIEATPADEVHPAAQYLARLKAGHERKSAVALPVANGLMDVDGVLRMFIDYCDATAFSRQPFLALGAAICAVGALAGRRYRTRTDLRTNIYGIGIADSGGGKDHARGVVKRVIYKADLGDYLGGSKIASGSGLLSALGRHPSMLFQLDEMGLWLQGVLGRNAASHQREIWANMMELYSSANGPFGGTEYANQKEHARIVLHQPNACIWGTSVPLEFWKALESGAMQNGSMARFLVFLSPCNYPDTPLPAVEPVPVALIEACKAIAAGVPGHDYGGNLAACMAATVDIEPYTVPETKDAYARLLELKAEELAWKRQAEGTYATAQIARMFENAYKLALIRAISTKPRSPCITAADVDWGARLARHCIDTLLREAGRFVADNEYEAKMNKALDIIRRFGPISGSDMVRRGFKFPERDRTEVLRTLETSGQIQAIEQAGEPKRGRPTIRYIVAIADT